MILDFWECLQCYLKVSRRLMLKTIARVCQVCFFQQRDGYWNKRPTRLYDSRNVGRESSDFSKWSFLCSLDLLTDSVRMGHWVLGTAPGLLNIIDRFKLIFFFFLPLVSCLSQVLLLCVLPRWCSMNYYLSNTVPKRLSLSTPSLFLFILLCSSVRISFPLIAVLPFQFCYSYFSRVDMACEYIWDCFLF